MDDTATQERAKLQADGEKELVRLWRAWRTIHEMCFDRVRTFFSSQLCRPQSHYSYQRKAHTNTPLHRAMS